MIRAHIELTTSALLLLAFAPVASTQSTQLVHAIEGEAAHDLLGISVAAVGDVDGDSVSDFVAGAHQYNLGPGMAKVFSGATGLPILTLVGTAVDDEFGWSVAGAGDVNRDGVPDIIVGARGSDVRGIDSGSAQVFSGSDGRVLYTFHGDAPGDAFGTAVAGAGDVNRDGYADVIIGAPCADIRGTDSGRARVYSGRDGSLIHTFDGDSAHDWFGYSVNSAGDVDKDNRDDLIVGACYDDSGSLSNNGSARIYSGRDGSLVHTLRGVATDDWFGVSVASIGDVDGDQRDDVIIGAPNSDFVATNAGSVTVVSGRSGAVIFRLYGQRAGDEFGVSVRSCGDFDGDSVGDFVIGAYRGSTAFPGAGSVYVYSGLDGDRIFTHHGEAADDRLGVSVAGIGDVTGDGLGDIAVGAVYADGIGPDAGRVLVFAGKPLALTVDVHTLPSTGGSQKMTLDAGSEHAGLTYRVAGSLSGTSPGIKFGKDLVVPLNYDTFTELTMQGANSSVFEGYLGSLDKDGRATAAIHLPMLDPSTVGLTIYHAFFAYDNRGRVQMTSNFVTLTITD